MPVLIVASLLVQIACAVHVVRSGRPLYWIFIIMATSFLGCVVYFFAAILPDFSESRTARRAASRLVSTMDPERELRRLTDRFETADTAENRRLLAEEWLRLGQPDRAIGLYEGALVGMHRNEPILLAGLAGAQLEAGRPGETVATLDRLRTENPDFQSADAHMLYARALEACGRESDALLEYDALVGYFPGVEARCRLGLLLERLGRTDDAQDAYRHVVRSLDKAGRSFRDSQREWYELARARLVS